ESPDDQIAEINLIMEQVSSHYSLIAPVLIRLKTCYNEIYSVKSTKEDNNEDAIKIAELNEKVKFLNRKNNLLKENEVNLNHSLCHLQTQIHTREALINEKTALIVSVLQEIPVSQDVSRKEFMVDWLNQKIKSGFDCSKELELLLNLPVNENNDKEASKNAIKENSGAQEH
ncbi:hypothetical protein ROZALSC1DRAFT_30064, partial [Rozella allomycis CSF55]